MMHNMMQGSVMSGPSIGGSMPVYELTMFVPPRVERALGDDFAGIFERPDTRYGFRTCAEGFMYSMTSPDPDLLDIMYTEISSRILSFGRRNPGSLADLSRMEFFITKGGQPSMVFMNPLVRQ